MSETGKVETVGELQVFILQRIEDSLFQLGNLVYSRDRYAASYALDLLWLVFPMLPPDIKRDLSKDQNRLEEIMFKEIPQYANRGVIGRELDEHTKATRIVARANHYRPWIKQVISDIQTLLYRRYLPKEVKTEFFDPSKGKKSGEGEHEGFSRRERARI